ncbi:Dihydroorotase [Anaerohalosphaera lusitana]|uniref:Dihydroorotase n=1 Tax=Anaerohalosphaera lusitana TaxID=1936003 RepID=A0A1U9NRJ4_9BACT|nr:dihydroorotase [Anaerohalosphaera lusitana]AQT70240.1 Dihydroorotase [Anaerohalosphaera lusitana]
MYTGNNILIKNGRLIDPANNVDQICDLFIKDGYVSEIGQLDNDCDHVIDATGKIISPGLIDVHVHFREPGDEEEETIASGSMAAVAGGFTSVVCMPNTKPAVDDATSIEFVHRMARQARKTFVYVMGAITQGRKGTDLAEMGLMQKAGAVGFTDDGAGIQDASIMTRALKYASMLDTVVSQHCQDLSLGSSGVMNSGYNSTVLGLPGMDPLAEEMMLWRDIQLVKRIGVRYHAQHISTAGSVKIIREAKQQGVPVTCEVSPHHLLLTDDCIYEYDTNYKVNPPLRTKADIAALREAIKEGVIDCLATDHAPHLKSEKELEFLAAPFGIASLECALSLYVKALIEPGIIDWPQLLALMTHKPASIIRIEKGTLAKGSIGDVTIIDPDAEYTINAEKFYSKSRNCPYHNWNVRAKVERTIVAGEVRYSAD